MKILLTLGVGLAGWALLATAGTLVALALWWTAPELRPGNGAARRARRLFLAGMLPSALALAGAGLLIPAFVLHEPAEPAERVGPLLLLAAVAGAALLAGGAWRALRDAHATRSLCRRWLGSARPLRLTGVTLPAPLPAHAFESSFPVASVVGPWRPRLFVSRRVIEGCAPEELAAILAHEQAHVVARDNLKRALLSAAPDPLAWTPLGRRLRRDWHAAAEAAADERAAAGRPEVRLALASALVRLARLAARPVPLAGAAVIDDAPVASRVRRLLAPAPEAPPSPAAAFALLLAPFLALLLLGLAHLDRVHAAGERLVALLG